MNYKKHYDMLIARSPTLKFNGEKKGAPLWNKRDNIYREGHRIVPGCMGGVYTCDNVVYLTAAEHFVAHQLLVKIYPKNMKLVNALRAMITVANGQVRNNKLYGWIRELVTIAQSQKFLGRRYYHNPITHEQVLVHPGNEPCGYLIGLSPTQLSKKRSGSTLFKNGHKLEKNPMDSPESRAKVGASKKGRTYVVDSITGKRRWTSRVN